MIETIIKSAISVIVSVALGFCISKIKDYKKRLKKKDDENNLTKEALMMMLQGSLTNTYFVYNEINKIPDYVLKNWLNSFKIYKKLGGNDFVDTLKGKIDTWQISKTDILDKEK